MLTSTCSTLLSKYLETSHLTTDLDLTIFFSDVMVMLMVWPSLVFWALLVPANVYTSGNLLLRRATVTELCKYFNEYIFSVNLKLIDKFNSDRPKPRDVMKAVLGKLFKNDSSTDEDDESNTDFTSSTSASESAM